MKISELKPIPDMTIHEFISKYNPCITARDAYLSEMAKSPINTMRVVWENSAVPLSDIVWFIEHLGLDYEIATCEMFDGWCDACSSRGDARVRAIGVHRLARCNTAHRLLRFCRELTPEDRAALRERVMLDFKPIMFTLNTVPCAVPVTKVADNVDEYLAAVPSPLLMGMLDIPPLSIEAARMQVYAVNVLKARNVPLEGMRKVTQTWEMSSPDRVATEEMAQHLLAGRVKYRAVESSTNTYAAWLERQPLQTVVKLLDRWPNHIAPGNYRALIVDLKRRGVPLEWCDKRGCHWKRANPEPDKTLPPERMVDTGLEYRVYVPSPEALTTLGIPANVIEAGARIRVPNMWPADFIALYKPCENGQRFLQLHMTKNMHEIWELPDVPVDDMIWFVGKVTNRNNITSGIKSALTGCYPAMVARCQWTSDDQEIARRAIRIMYPNIFEGAPKTNTDRFKAMSVAEAEKLPPNMHEIWLTVQPLEALIGMLDRWPGQIGCEHYRRVVVELKNRDVPLEIKHRDDKDWSDAGPQVSRIKPADGLAASGTMYRVKRPPSALVGTPSGSATVCNITDSTEIPMAIVASVGSLQEWTAGLEKMSTDAVARLLDLWYPTRNIDAEKYLSVVRELKRRKVPLEHCSVNSNGWQRSTPDPYKIPTADALKASNIAYRVMHPFPELAVPAPAKAQAAPPPRLYIEGAEVARYRGYVFCNRHGDPCMMGTAWMVTPDCETLGMRIHLAENGIYAKQPNAVNNMTTVVPLFKPNPEVTSEA